MKSKHLEEETRFFVVTSVNRVVPLTMRKVRVKVHWRSGRARKVWPGDGRGYNDSQHASLSVEGKGTLARKT